MSHPHLYLIIGFEGHLTSMLYICTLYLVLDCLNLTVSCVLVIIYDDLYHLVTCYYAVVLIKSNPGCKKKKKKREKLANVNMKVCHTTCNLLMK